MHEMPFEAQCTVKLSQLFRLPADATANIYTMSYKNYNSTVHLNLLSNYVHNNVGVF